MNISITKAQNGILLDKGVTDLIKFASCILIALHHYSQYATGHAIGNNFVYSLFSAAGGYLGVAVFFFLSGYGLMKSEQIHHLGPKTFFTRRFMKVYLPVLFATLLWVPIYLNLGQWNGSGMGLVFNILGGG